MTGAMTASTRTASEELGDNPICASDVVVRFGATAALDHFSVDVPRGVVGLLGPNGAGKSTFIKAVLGLLDAESGRISVEGLDPSSDKMAIRDLVGYMPEHDCLIEAMTGVELVSYMGQISGMAKQDSIPRSHEVLDFVGLNEQRYRPISTYSTGMKQRIKLAQAIVHDPKIIFLDEPTSGMDPQGREEMLDLIGRIAATDKSILLSSHILNDVEMVCKNVIIVSNGKAVTQGGIESLLSQGTERKRVVLRGQPDAFARFMGMLSSEHEVLSVSEEFKQYTVVFVNTKESTSVFELAHQFGVQLRSYLPDRFDLEDVFIDALKGAC
ncbi:MAG: ABC transporter ATP-binding protein [Methanomassiliicoccales archaeon]|nr:ABC transporter ATP-binding protein [Methanomassiliicoccales archaeon]